MHDAIHSFYAEKSSDAVDVLSWSPAYKEISEKIIHLENNLLLSFSGDQKALYDLADTYHQKMISMAYDAIYKAGFLDGFAAGSVTSKGDNDD
jgi:hypothetical protein